MTTTKKYKHIQTFKPLEWQIEPWKDTSPTLLLTGSAGGGKLLDIHTPIPTPLGWKTMKDIRPGHYVFGEDGMPVKVVAVSDVEYPRCAYEIEFDDGSKIIAGSDHYWLSHTAAARASLRNRRNRLEEMGGDYRLKPRGTDQRGQYIDPVVLTTEQIKNSLVAGRGIRRNHAVIVAGPLQLPEKFLPVPPYLFGLWLGDGHSSCGGYTAHREDAFLLDEWERYGYRVKRRLIGNQYACYIKSLVYSLRSMGVLNNKRIPTAYLRGSYRQRLELLQGIVDSDGHVDKRGRISIDMVRLNLMQDIKELVNSLGVKCRISDSPVKSQDGKTFVRYRMKFSANIEAARLPRKRARLKLDSDLRDTQSFRYVVAVNEVENRPMKCIEVDNSSHLYLCGHDFIPTHNSKLAAEKAHGFCLRYPNATVLVLRKVRATMHNSTLLFLKRHIIGDDPRVYHKPSEFRFEYDNGSIMAYGGMKDEEQRERIRSVGQMGGIDMVWMEESTEFQEEDYNEILARMRGQAAPWRQIVLTTNPDAPAHWINVRLILGGEASVYYSNSSSNKYNPSDYKASLERLSGVQYQRLVLGEWVSGSGKVLDTWVDAYNAKTGRDNGGNVTDDAEYIPGGGRVIWGIDDGYTGSMDENTRMFSGRSHPRAFIFAQQRFDGTLAVFGEHFAIKTLADAHIRQAMQLCQRNGWPLKPDIAIRDRSAAALGGALEQAGIRSTFSQVPVDESVKELRAWIAPDVNHVRRLVVHNRCFYMRYQMQTYSMDMNGNIIKEHDDGPDALRYIVWDLAYGASTDVDIATIYGVVQ